MNALTFSFGITPAISTKPRRRIADSYPPANGAYIRVITAVTIPVPRSPSRRICDLYSMLSNAKQVSVANIYALGSQPRFLKNPAIRAGIILSGNIQPMMLPISTSEYPPTVRFFIPTFLDIGYIRNAPIPSGTPVTI